LLQLAAEQTVTSKRQPQPGVIISLPIHAVLAMALPQLTVHTAKNMAIITGTTPEAASNAIRTTGMT
jgi:hypothetical protein